MNILIVITRIIFLYFLIIFGYKIIDIELKEFKLKDFIVLIFISFIAINSVYNYTSSILIPILSITILLLIEIINIKLLDNKIEDIIFNNPIIIINKGKLNFKDIIRSKYNIKRLLVDLRKKGIKSIDEVKYALLERNGELSILTYSGNYYGNYSMPLILNGKIQNIPLKEIDKDEKWIKKMLSKNKISIDKIFYAFYHNNKLFIIKNDYQK